MTKTCKHCDQPRANGTLCKAHFAEYQKERRRVQALGKDEAAKEKAREHHINSMSEAWRRMSPTQRTEAVCAWSAIGAHIALGEDGTPEQNRESVDRYYDLFWRYQKEFEAHMTAAALDFVSKNLERHQSVPLWVEWNEQQRELVKKCEQMKADGMDECEISRKTGMVFKYGRWFDVRNVR